MVCLTLLPGEDGDRIGSQFLVWYNFGVSWFLSRSLINSWWFVVLGPNVCLVNYSRAIKGISKFLLNKTCFLVFCRVPQFQSPLPLPSVGIWVCGRSFIILSWMFVSVRLLPTPWLRSYTRKSLGWGRAGPLRAAVELFVPGLVKTWKTVGKVL